MEEHFDVVIIGSGPAGLAAAIQAARTGISHCVLERAAFANTIRAYAKGKWVMAEPANVALHDALPMRFEADTREAVLDTWQQDAAAAGIVLRAGPEFEVVSIVGEAGQFSVELASGTSIGAGAVILAIGTSGNPRRFDQPGAGLPHIGYELSDPAAHSKERITIVGVGDAGIEDALALAEHDNDVTMVARREGFDRAKHRNRVAIEDAIQNGEIRHIPLATPTRFDPGLLRLNTPDGEVLVESDWIIGRLGATPPRAFLEHLGLEFESSDPEALPRFDETFQSTRPGIYVVGSLTGRNLIKFCINQGFEVIERLHGREIPSADEHLLRETLSILGPDPASAIESIRKSVDLLGQLSRGQLRDLLVDSRIHMVRRGDTIYDDGDFGECLYAVLGGVVETYSSTAARRSGEAPTGRFEAGDYFGEESLLSGRRRSGIAVAPERAVLIETSRLALERAIKAVPELRTRLDRGAILRKLEQMLPMLTPLEREDLAEAAVIETYAPDEVLFEEGDPSDGLHLIRRGSLVVSRNRDERERAVNYVQAGSYLGEIALVQPEQRRTATVRAMVRTETVRIPTDAILEVTRRYPQLRTTFERSWKQKLARDEQSLAVPETTDILDFVIAKGGKEATDLLVIDEKLCIRCDNCETACGSTHYGVSRLDREGGPRMSGLHLPTACQHCENPLCMTDCPPDALRRHPDGEVYILDTCIGCGTCASYCTYGVIKMEKLESPRRHSVLFEILFGRRLGQKRARSSPAADGASHEVAVKCDLCRELSGDMAHVACIAACPTGAIVRLNPMDLVEELLSRTDN